MRLTYIHIQNFKSIRDMEIRDIDRALILVGKNNTGKTSVLDAVCAALGCYEVQEQDFNEQGQAVRIAVRLELSGEDLELFHRLGRVSKYRRRDAWLKSFCERLPSFEAAPEQGSREEAPEQGSREAAPEHGGREEAPAQRGQKETAKEILPGGELFYTFRVSPGGRPRYEDGRRKDNPYIPMILPKVYRISAERELAQLQNDLLLSAQGEEIRQLKSESCVFEASKTCTRCFQCIGLIDQKTPGELTAAETARLLEYKVYQMNLGGMARRINENFRKNGGYEELYYALRWEGDRLFDLEVTAYNPKQDRARPVELMGRGMRSIYMLSLLETYTSQEGRLPSIIVVEEPELFLHPQLQKTCGEILYRLSLKNQVIFQTHSPDLLFNFTIRQIRQVVLDEDRFSIVRAQTDLGRILDDLGYGASDLMNVSFVFIVEGKQDKSRLPLLLEKYYSEIFDAQGRLARISIITTNSCTNIKTYANLKYMNQVYLRDQFLMIRDGDGEDPEELAGQLCRYYEERSREDADRLPRVTRKNVLILRYYSFENYFLNPAVMAKLGIVESQEAFYRTLFEKWREYLCRIRSGQRLLAVMGRDFASPEDMREHMEEIRIHLRGHNLYDIFYGRYKEEETELLRRYIDLAPRENFQDILDGIDRFVYFESRRIDLQKS